MLLLTRLKILVSSFCWLIMCIRSLDIIFRKCLEVIILNVIDIIMKSNHVNHAVGFPMISLIWLLLLGGMLFFFH